MSRKRSWTSWVNHRIALCEASEAVKMCAASHIAACIVGAVADDKTVETLLNKLIDGPKASDFSLYPFAGPFAQIGHKSANPLRRKALWGEEQQRNEHTPALKNAEASDMKLAPTWHPELDSNQRPSA